MTHLAEEGAGGVWDGGERPGVQHGGQRRCGRPAVGEGTLPLVPDGQELVAAGPAVTPSALPTSLLTITAASLLTITPKFILTITQAAILTITR